MYQELLDTFAASEWQHTIYDEVGDSKKVLLPVPEQFHFPWLEDLLGEGEGFTDFYRDDVRP